jgi:hypothetical protein
VKSSHILCQTMILPNSASAKTALMNLRRIIMIYSAVSSYMIGKRPVYITPVSNSECLTIRDIFVILRQ